MKYTIEKIEAFEILDSRGDPTVKAVVTTNDGQQASAAVPAGASTGRHEAHELRDGGKRYGGKGVTRAVANVRERIADVLHGHDVEDQSGLDRRMIERDGTADRSVLGANAILSVSLAAARLAALVRRQPLYAYLRERYGLPPPERLPRPMCNLLNGGQHADNGLSFQEFMVLPNGSTVGQQLERTSAIIRSLRKILRDSQQRTLVGDEGGFAPMLPSNTSGLELLAQAVEQAGLQLGQDIEFGIDAAASEFVRADGRYDLMPERRTVSSDGMIDLYEELVGRFPLKSIEDGLAEDEWEPWTKLTARLGQQTLLVGDDLFVTQRDRLSQGIRARAANAVLIKPNQVGTLTETMETVATARDDGYACVVSHRSGETSDDFIADLAVATGSEFLKAGSLARGERLAKYNRLLAIAAEIGR